MGLFWTIFIGGIVVLAVAGVVYLLATETPPPTWRAVDNGDGTYRVEKIDRAFGCYTYIDGGWTKEEADDFIASMEQQA